MTVLQVAVYESDGVPLTQLRNRLLSIQTTFTLTSGKIHTPPDTFLVVPDDGIVRHSLIPDMDVKVINIRVSIRSRNHIGLCTYFAVNRTNCNHLFV